MGALMVLMFTIIDKETGKFIQLISHSVNVLIATFGSRC